MTPNKAEMEAAEEQSSVPRFRPLAIRGEPLSATIIRDRGGDPYWQKEPLSDTVTPLQIQQCCVVLGEAEAVAQGPILLGWFRDDALLHSHRFDWLGTPESRQRVIDKAVEVGAIKLHEVSDTSGSEPLAMALSLVKFEPPRNGKRYNPIIVHGEPISQTLIRDRGGY
jgi:hypothetical protein